MQNPEVLRNKKDFSLLYKRGNSVGDRYVVLIFKENKRPYTRKAFLASKKVGKSVERNRARRLMKESVRTLDASLKEGYDIIFIARNTIGNSKCADVKKSIEAALKKARLLEQDTGPKR